MSDTKNTCQERHLREPGRCKYEVRDVMFPRQIHAGVLENDVETCEKTKTDSKVCIEVHKLFVWRWPSVTFRIQMYLSVPVHNSMVKRHSSAL